MAELRTERNTVDNLDARSECTFRKYHTGPKKFLKVYRITSRKPEIKLSFLVGKHPKFERMANCFSSGS